MFSFFKKEKKDNLVEPKKDPFPTQDDLKNLIIIDIRDEEDIKHYGKYPNSIFIPFDEYFGSKLLMLDKTKKYGIMDLKGDKAKEATVIAKDVGLNVKELKGGFFYISEILNIKPIKDEQ